MLANGWDTEPEIPENRQGGVGNKPPKLGGVYPSALAPPSVFLGAEMAAWIESHQTLREHPKIYKLMDLLQISRAEVIGHLHMLWWWVIDYAPRGNLAEFGSRTLAKAADWQKDPDEFIKALHDSGFLTDGESGLEVHDWLDYCGELIKKRLVRESERRRKMSANFCQFPPKVRLPNRTEPNRTISPISPFEMFWEIYPKKVGKGAALKAWDKAKLNGKVEIVLQAVEKQKTWPQWQKDGGQYIPNPATWINQGRWEDQPVEEQKEGRTGVWAKKFTPEPR